MFVGASKRALLHVFLHMGAPGGVVTLPPPLNPPVVYSYLVCSSLQNWDTADVTLHHRLFKQLLNIGGIFIWVGVTSVGFCTKILLGRSTSQRSTKLIKLYRVKI